MCVCVCKQKLVREDILDINVDISDYNMFYIQELRLNDNILLTHINSYDCACIFCDFTIKDHKA